MEREMETYNQLRTKSSIQAQGTFVLDDLLEAVDGVLVQELTDDLGTLVLHASLDKIDRVDNSGTNSSTDGSQQETV